MNDGDLLLRAVLLHPEEDAPRLIYADWLDENGQGDRAEFIRLQIELYNTPFIRNGGTHAIWPEPWATKQRRARQLAEAHAREWVGALAALYRNWPDRSFAGWFVRGFVAHARFPRGTFLESCAAVFREHPVTRVDMDGRYPRRATLTSGPYLWDRVTGDVVRQPWQVPAAIYDRMEAPAEGFRYSDGATQALSAALVAHGREAAGLVLEPQEAA